MKFPLALLGIALALPAWAMDSTEPALVFAPSDTKPANGSGTGQVPESLKRKVKPSALIKKPIVVRRF
jgi:hypothetical protein